MVAARQKGPISPLGQPTFCVSHGSNEAQKKGTRTKVAILSQSIQWAFWVLVLIVGNHCEHHGQLANVSVEMSECLWDCYTEQCPAQSNAGPRR